MASALLLKKHMLNRLKRLLFAPLLAGLFALPSAHALSISDLDSIPALTPEKLARSFADFKFVFHAEVQEADVFLKTKSGDCDDFATVAAAILSRHGYTPHLIAVRMKGECHVVCYVDEVKGYLDYNYRSDAHPVIASGNSITEIARKVADSFGRDWIATYEFTFHDATKRLVNNILPNRFAKTDGKALLSSSAAAEHK